MCRYPHSLNVNKSSNIFGKTKIINLGLLKFILEKFQNKKKYVSLYFRFFFMLKSNLIKTTGLPTEHYLFY